MDARTIHPSAAGLKGPQARTEVEGLPSAACGPAFLFSPPHSHPPPKILSPGSGIIGNAV
jgi:hypothetical protein